MKIDKIVEVLGLQKAKIRDDELSACCPFAKETHEKGYDKNPSWSLNLDQLVYNCFTCGERGTLEDLVCYVLDIDVPHALDVIIGDFDIDPLEHEFKVVTKPKLIELPTMYFPEGKLAEFDRVEDITYEMYTGVLTDVYDREIECKIYPVRDRNTRLVGAVARSLEGRFHKNMWGFHKADFLLGEEEITEGEQIIIVEGPGDRAALREARFHNVVALMGSKPSKTQTLKLIALSNRFIIWPDKDDAGKNIISWGINTLEPLADEVLYVNPFMELNADENDPKDAFIKRGAIGIRNLLRGAKTSIEYEAIKAGVLDKQVGGC
jgi:DNA primase